MQVKKQAQSNFQLKLKRHDKNGQHCGNDSKNLAI